LVKLQNALKTELTWAWFWPY